MAIIDFLFQGQEPTQNHVDYFKRIVETTENIEEIIISVAFVRANGVHLFDDILKDYYTKTSIYLGIRNGITSIQALFNLIHRNIKVYAVDTASPAILYHPKIYGVLGEVQATLIIGSANLTSGGLYRNIESSLEIRFNRDEEDFAIWGKYSDSLNFLKRECGENVLEIDTKRKAYELFLDGLLADERIVSKPKINGKQTINRNLDRAAINIRSKKISAQQSSKKRKQKREIDRELNVNSIVLLWESNPLTERDLNIPTGQSTNPTGSMLFKKGAIEGIDQRHFFREEIFNELNWMTDVNKPHIERAYGNFLLVVKEINYGEFRLKLSHNMDTESATYRQKNSMTQIHWGEIKEFIAKKSLLDCIFKLYKPKDNNDHFILTIE